MRSVEREGRGGGGYLGELGFVRWLVKINLVRDLGLGWIGNGFGMWSGGTGRS